MKIGILLFMALTCSVLATAEKPPMLRTREFKIPSGFLNWIEQASSPRETAGKEDLIAGRMEVCGSFFGEWADGVFVRGATATVHVQDSSITVRHTPPFLYTFGALVAQCRKKGLRSEPDPKVVKLLQQQGHLLDQ